MYEKEEGGALVCSRTVNQWRKGSAILGELHCSHRHRVTQFLSGTSLESAVSYGFVYFNTVFQKLLRTWLQYSDFKHNFEFYSHSFGLSSCYLHIASVSSCSFQFVSISKMRSPCFPFYNGVFRQPGSPSLHMFGFKSFKSWMARTAWNRAVILLWNASAWVFVYN